MEYKRRVIVSYSKFSKMFMTLKTRISSPDLFVQRTELLVLETFERGYSQPVAVLQQWPLVAQNLEQLEQQLTWFDGEFYQYVKLKVSE